ncbi:hypothetical protein Tsubulata_016534 [Turnera subulata]|uniref:Cholesterol oxidase n=1 Tax=Turnera subulata TaxID=218843 RepID=A0A9Q0J945_9ROSI|nr:hypothetical protein Tsubulata_016534 [Turnera subulata]
MVLNAMGYDKSDGKITFNKSSNKICFRPPHDPLLPRKVEAFQKLTKKLGGILFMSRYRSTSVHLLGGCNASPDSSGGVCSHKGQVFHSKNPSTVHQGLYVCDASVIPCSIGINPCLTIATATKHISKHLVKDILNYKAHRREDFIGVTDNSNPVADTWISFGHSMQLHSSGQRNYEGLFGGCSMHCLSENGNELPEEYYCVDILLDKNQKEA